MQRNLLCLVVAPRIFDQESTAALKSQMLFKLCAGWILSIAVRISLNTPNVL